MKKHTPYQETVQLAELLKQKPEIDQKIKYFKEVLRSTDALIKGIDNRIEVGFTLENFRFMGMDVKKRVMLDDYAIARLSLEKYEAENKLFTQQNYFESWLQRSAEYEKKYAEIVADCEANWDLIMEEANQYRKQNFRLNGVMEAYKNPDNDQKLKTEYYLYCKQEVENRREAVGKRFSAH